MVKCGKSNPGTRNYGKTPLREVDFTLLASKWPNGGVYSCLGEVFGGQLNSETDRVEVPVRFVATRMLIRWGSAAGCLHVESNR